MHVTIDAGRGPLDARLMVDTGASTFIDLNRPFVEANKLVEAMPDAAATERPAAIGSKAPFLYGEARRVVFAGTTFEAPRLGLSRATSGSSTSASRDGILGNDLLRHFKATFDYRRQVLVLEKYPGRSAAFCGRLFGGQLPGVDRGRGDGRVATDAGREAVGDHFERVVEVA